MCRVSSCGQREGVVAGSDLGSKWGAMGALVLGSFEKRHKEQKPKKGCKIPNWRCQIIGLVLRTLDMLLGGVRNF